jgi:hypothetical protein
LFSERGIEMIKAIVKIENQWSRGEISVQEVEFEKIGEIEDYLAYNRAYIQEIKFVGKIVKEAA